MRLFHVKVTPDAKADVRECLQYIRNRLKNDQAARNVAEDFRETTEELKVIADALAEPESQILRKRGLKRINFKRHNYFLLYRITGDAVEVINVFHGSEDYENKLR